MPKELVNTVYFKVPPNQNIQNVDHRRHTAENIDVQFTFWGQFCRHRVQHDGGLGYTQKYTYKYKCCEKYNEKYSIAVKDITVTEKEGTSSSHIHWSRRSGRRCSGGGDGLDHDNDEDDGDDHHDDHDDHDDHDNGADDLDHDKE